MNENGVHVVCAGISRGVGGGWGRDSLHPSTDSPGPGGRGGSSQMTQWVGPKTLSRMGDLGRAGPT